MLVLDLISLPHNGDLVTEPPEFQGLLDDTSAIQDLLGFCSGVAEVSASLGVR